MASIWQQPSGIWCITYRKNGKQVVRSLKTKSKRDALRLKAAIESELTAKASFTVGVITSKPKRVEKNPTTDEFWTAFSAWAMLNRTRPTVAEYKVWFEQFVAFTQIERLGDVTAKHIEDFKAKLLTGGQKKKTGLTKRSVNNALRTLSSICNLAGKLEIFSGENLFASIERCKLPEKNDRDYLDSKQIDALIEAAREYCKKPYVREAEARNIYLAIALMALAGLRKREVCFSRWEWIDWDKRIITVVNSDEFVTKNKKSRTISMNDRLTEILSPHKKADGYILEALRPSEGKTNYRADFKKLFSVICTAAGIKATPHDLRHSFASRHAVAGTSLHVIAGWLGHSTTWITQRYAHFQKTFNAAANNI